LTQKKRKVTFKHLFYSTADLNVHDE